MKKGINLTVQQANEHQLKHGFAPVQTVFAHGTDAENKIPRLNGKQPNKTEAEFGRILESQKQRGEIIRYQYEGMTFRWLDMRYTPDWIVIWKRLGQTEAGMYTSETLISAIEVKGGHIFDRDIVRFKGCRALWPEITFEMWQRKAGQWARIY